jgi:hypothetical protein
MGILIACKVLQNVKYNDSKIPTKREKIFRKTFEKMEGFSFVTPVTGLNRPNTGKQDDDDDGDDLKMLKG